MTDAVASIAILDIGKTNAKLVCVDRAGRVQAVRRRAVDAQPGPPYPHLDTEGLWAWAQVALGELGRDRTIDTLVPVSHGATAALIGSEGLALPVLDYEHEGPAAAMAYGEVRPPFAETLSPALPAGLNLGRQLFWQADRFVDAFARVEAILTYPQYWAWRLSGVAASERTALGCHTDLWWPKEDVFSSLVDRMGWRDLFPPLRYAGDSLGAVSPLIARHAGLDPATRVLAGIHDSNAAFFRHLSAFGTAPFAVLSTGTWCIAMAGNSPLPELATGRDCLANVDVSGRPVACARFMGGRAVAHLFGADPVCFADLDAAMAVLPTLIKAPTFALPAFNELGGPYAGCRGEIAGPAPRSGPERFALASLYAALMSATCLDLVAARGPLVIEGSFASNSLYCGLLAALRPEAPVLVSKDPTGTVEGAALLAGARVPPPALREARPVVLAGLADYRLAWRDQAEARRRVAELPNA